jgi:TetR/AcrR family transcriptional regulator, cholesterol catabolism regulator
MSRNARKRTYGKRGPYAPDATRQALLDASLELFSERGFHGATVQAVSQRAGVTKGAFYHHFESKEDVLQQIHEEYAGEMVAGAREVAAADLSPAEQLRAIIERAVVALGVHREAVAVFYQENRFLSGRSYKAIRAMHDEQEQILLDIIDRAIAAGEVRKDVDPKLLMFAISGMTGWIYQWYQPDGPLTLEQIAEQLADIILLPVLTADLVSA